MDAGWDNVTYRVGGELAIRIPRRETAVALLLNEQRWLPVLGSRLGIAVPLPTRSGEPRHESIGHTILANLLNA
jgi:aminoglycoside phosphotransferase (APT) family kinase protein